MCELEPPSITQGVSVCQEHLNCSYDGEDNIFLVCAIYNACDFQLQMPVN